MRCDRIDFFVEIVFQRRMLDGGGEQRHHVGAEGFRNDDRRIVLAGFHAVDGLGAVHELPVELVVGSQCAQHRLAHVDAHRNQLRLVAGVHVRDRHLQRLRVAVWIPAGGDVEPCVQRRYDHQSHRDDQGDHIACGMAHVTSEDTPEIFHRAYLSFRYSTTIR